MKVSIAMVTYNHEQYIAKALDSVLMQKTNFDYEIVIGEDCSTDGTRAIVIDYQHRYPDIFRLLLNGKNLGMHKNADQTINACKGEYVAMLDGDDYWTSPHKLQKQVDFFESHLECSICFHDALIVHEDGSKEPSHYRPSQKEFSTLEDLLIDNYIPTCAVMLRRGLIGKVPAWVKTLKMGDWVIYILNALHGKVGYINETMGVYVVHRDGVWSSKGWRHHATAIIELFEALNKHLGAEYRWIIHRILRWRYFSISEQFENAGEVVTARNYAIKSLAKHVAIVIEPLRPGHNKDVNSAGPIPDFMNSVTSAQLLRIIVRLTMEPLLKAYPILHKSLRTAARLINISL